MSNLVFQANSGGSITLTGANTASTATITIPATTGNMVTTGDSGTVTVTMISATGTPSSSTFLRGDGSWSATTAQVYPGAGIANSTGSAWGTSYTTSGTGTVVALATGATLSSPVISTIVNSGTLTLPTSTDTLVGRATTDTLTNKTLTNPTVTNYVETLQAVGTVGSTSTLALTTGTVLTATLTASTPCTFTMPTATAGKSFILKLTQAATGMTTATFTSVKFPGGTAPTITATASAVDILSFVSDGTNWYGTFAQAFA
jgi:hypothetical protein